MKEMREGSSEAEDATPGLSLADPDRLLTAALLVQRALGLESPPTRFQGVVSNVPSTQSTSINPYVHHSSLPREAVINILRLPPMDIWRGEQILRFTYFLDELHSVPIVLADSPLPPSITRTAGGMAIVGLTGTLLEVRSADEAEVRRVQQFLDDKLQPYEVEQETDHDRARSRRHGTHRAVEAPSPAG